MTDTQRAICTLVHPPETTVQVPRDPSELGFDGPRLPEQGSVGWYNPGIRFRHSGWKRDRERVYDALLATGQPLNRSFSFMQCGKHAYVLQSTSDPGKYLIGGSTCHDRFCLPCGRERSRRIASNVINKLETNQARFLTLTVRSENEPLSVLMDKLTNGFTALRRTKLWTSKVTGGVAFIEIKWYKDRQRWHPHFHILVQGKYLPKAELSKLWLRITGDSSIIDIRFVKDNAHVTHYVAKYATKPMDHTVIHEPVQLREAILALKGKRLCMTFGAWQGYALTAALDGDSWVNLGLLSEVVKAATEGDPVANEALEALRIDVPVQEEPTIPRAPPKSSCDDSRNQGFLFPRRRSFYDLYE